MCSRIKRRPFSPPQVKMAASQTTSIPCSTTRISSSRTRWRDGASHHPRHLPIPLMQSYDRVLRKSAFDSLYSVYGQFRNTSAATLSAQLKQLLFYASCKYPSTLDAALDSTEVPTEIYRNLIDAVHRSFGPMYRYVELRKSCSAWTELHMYDRVPVVEGVEMKFTFGGEGDRSGARARRGLSRAHPRGLLKTAGSTFENEESARARIRRGRARASLCAAQLQGHARRCVHARARDGPHPFPTCPTPVSRPHIRTM